MTNSTKLYFKHFFESCIIKWNFFITIKKKISNRFFYVDKKLKTSLLTDIRPKGEIFTKNGNYIIYKRGHTLFFSYFAIEFFFRID